MGPEQAARGPACGLVLMCFRLAVPPLVHGLAIRLGYYKRYFLERGPAPFFGPANYHFVILVGAIMIILGLAGLPGDVETRQDLLGYLFIPSIILAFIVGFWQPWWLKPKWIRQLKENHPDIYPFLREAAQEEVGNDREKIQEWSARMDTVDGRNEWVAEVRKRYGWPEPGGSEPLQRSHVITQGGDR